MTSRSSAFSYKGKEFKIADVGRELNVGHVLEGSVRLSGDHDAALASMNREVVDGRRIASRALVFQAVGDIERARAELEALIKLGYQWSYEIARNYAFRGELDEAFVWLDRAFDRRDVALVFAAGDPFLDNLRNDPLLMEVADLIGHRLQGWV